jgi:chromosome segregation ATPase
LAKCPKCGTEKTYLIKTWPMPVKKRTKDDKNSQSLLGIFECSNCSTRFRAVVEAQSKTEETVSIKNMVERIRGIKGELMQTLKNLREKIKTLETERSNLIIEIDKLKKVAESRVSALESEVLMLRDEVKSLRDLLGYTDEPERQKK